MRQMTLEQALDGLPLGPLRYFERVGSTNDEAAIWAEAGAPDRALVVADGQTAGRGRKDRKWHTPQGAALAFSLVLKDLPDVSQMEPPESPFPETIARLTALGALAVAEALRQEYGLAAQIKWPNDVLLDRRKVAGVLAEIHWLGVRPSAAILGIGVNVTPEALPPQATLLFPATCVQAALGYPPERPDLLRAVLVHLLKWRARLGEPDFLRAWEELLAFRDEWVYVVAENGRNEPETRQGQVLGLDSQGRLRLRDRAGETFTMQVGEVRLRPLDIFQETYNA